jgi:hypothetical protein
MPMKRYKPEQIALCCGRLMDFERNGVESHPLRHIFTHVSGRSKSAANSRTYWSIIR